MTPFPPSIGAHHTSLTPGNIKKPKDSTKTPTKDCSVNCPPGAHSLTNKRTDDPSPALKQIKTALENNAPGGQTENHDPLLNDSQTQATIGAKSVPDNRL